MRAIMRCLVLPAVLLTFTGCGPTEGDQKATARKLIAGWCAGNIEHPDAGVISLQLGEGAADDRHCLAKLRIPDPSRPGGWTFATFDFRLDLRANSAKVIDVGISPAMLGGMRATAKQIEADAARIAEQNRVMDEAERLRKSREAAETP